MRDFTNNQISNLAKFDYKKSVLIMGAAPSLKLARKFRDLAEIKIGVGDVPWRASEFGPFDFWVTANAEYPLPWDKKHLNHLLDSKANILLSSTSVSLTKNLENIFETLEKIGSVVPITFYNQRHFGGSSCITLSSCCYFSKQFVTDPPIQEMLSLCRGKTSPAYSEGDSVFLHALALAVILQSKNIYITGVEIPQVYKDYKYYKDYRSPTESQLDTVKRIVKRFIPKYRNQVPATSHDQIKFFHDIQKIVNVAKDLDINVYSLSRSSPLNFITGIRYLELKAF
jgi:hypothetical protein